MDKNYKVVFAAQKKVELQECEMPVVGDDDFLIQTEVSQISTGTELTILEGNVEPGSPWEANLVYPQDPGYSNVGRIIAVGKNVSGEYVGKRVLTLQPHKKYCTVKASEYDILFVPDSVKSEEAVFGIIAQITMGSIRASAMRPGDVCVVYGAGLIGQMVARFAKAAGATKVFVTDVSDFRLGKLPDDSCYIPVNTTKEKTTEVIKKYNNGELANIVFETTSVPALIAEEISCLAERGKLIVTSSPKGKSVVDFDYCNRMGITIIGAHNFAVHTPCEIPADRWTRKNDSAYFLELVEKKQLTVAEMITHETGYQNAVDMYHMLMKDRTQALAVHMNWEE